MKLSNEKRLSILNNLRDGAGYLSVAAIAGGLSASLHGRPVIAFAAVSIAASAFSNLMKKEVEFVELIMECDKIDARHKEVLEELKAHGTM